MDLDGFWWYKCDKNLQKLCSFLGRTESPQPAAGIATRSAAGTVRRWTAPRADIGRVDPEIEGAAWSGETSAMLAPWESIRDIRASKVCPKKVQMERLMGLMGVNKKKSKLQWFSLNFNKCIHVLHDSRFFDLRYGWICLLELCGNLPEIPGIAPEHSRMIQAGLVPVFWILLFILGAKTRVMLGFFIYKCFRLFARFALIELQV